MFNQSHNLQSSEQFVILIYFLKYLLLLKFDHFNFNFSETKSVIFFLESQSHMIIEYFLSIFEIRQFQVHLLSNITSIEFFNFIRY